MRIALTRRAVVVMSATALASGLLLLPATPACANINIDQFTSVADANLWPYASNTVGSSTVTESALAAVLGGVRKTTISTTSIGSPALDSVHVTVDPNSQGGVLDFSSTLQASANVKLLYDGGTGDLNANFSNESGISMTFIGYDQGVGASNFLKVTINDGVNSASLNLLNTIESGKVLFSFASFTGIGSVNLASINTVQVEFNHGSLAVDFRLDEIHTVTIPAPAAVWVFGAMLLGGRRRRR